jgi:hypothetical protein
MSSDRCDVCGRSPARPVVYGYPTPAALDEAERGEIVLGGCEIDTDRPRRLCSQCAAAESDQDDEDRKPPR